MTIMLESYARQHDHLVVGLMSGTSADGIDAALIQISGANEAPQIRLLASMSQEYPLEMRRRLLALDAESAIGEVCELNFEIGEKFGEAALEVVQNAGVAPSKVDLIGSHGQTVCHLPNRATRSTLQIGEPSVIAFRTGIPTIADFRTADIAAGGQGAPLIPMTDYLLLRHETKNRIIQNIGGIANLTYLSAGCRPEEIVAFDTGPGNMLIDGVVRLITSDAHSYDADGARAAHGKIDARLLSELKGHPFLHKDPPRTTGREEFGREFAKDVVLRARDLGLSEEDCIATVTAYTVVTIADAYRQYIPNSPDACDVIVGGGGTKNRTLMTLLAQEIRPWPLLTHEDVGIPSDAKEAIAFALLAHLTACGLPGNVPSATGASRSVPLGKIAIPRGRGSD